METDSDNRQLAEAGVQFLIRGNVVRHLSVVELFVGHHIKVSRTGQTEYDGLFLAGLLALQGFINGDLNGMGAFGSGEDALNACKILCGLENLGLLDGYGFHQSVVIQLRQG